MERRGFTLIELLVVIAIIAVLMAILMPSLRLARDQAQAIRCMSNVRTLTMAWLFYKDDGDGSMVGGHVGGTNSKGHMVDWVDSPVSGSGDPILEKQEGIKQGQLWSYVKTMEVYHCPGDLRMVRHNQDAYRSYSISGNMYGEERFSTWSARALIKFEEIKNPYDRYVFVEEIDPRGYNMGSWVVSPTSNSWIDPLAIWHNKRSTMGWADGRADKHRWVDESTIEMAERAAYGDQATFNFSPGPGEGEDLKFMKDRYQLWPSTRQFP